MLTTALTTALRKSDALLWSLDTRLACGVQIHIEGKDAPTHVK